MLSQFLRFSLADARKQQGKLLDLAVDLAGGDYPLVTDLLYQNSQKQLLRLPWKTVQAIDWRRRQILVKDLETGQPAPPDSLETAVLLKRDILDALVLNLQEHRATRANDLWLEEEDGQLYLQAADVSPGAVLRRISRGLLARRANKSVYDWKYVEFLRGDPQAARAGRDYHRRIAHLPPGEIARLSESLPYLHAAELLTLLPDPLAADTLEAMTGERQLQIFEELEEQQAIRLLALMRPDEGADLLGRLDPQQAQRYLEQMPTKRAEQVIELLRYPEDTAGGIMTNDVVTAPARLTIAEAQSLLRQRLQEPDFVYFIYVIDDDTTRQLCGVISLREFFIADPQRRLEELMNEYLTTVFHLESADEAAYRVIDSELVALPVITRDRQLLGAITIDAAVARVAPASWRSEAPRLFS